MSSSIASSTESRAKRHAVSGTGDVRDGTCLLTVSDDTLLSVCEFLTPAGEFRSDSEIMDQLCLWAELARLDGVHSSLRRVIASPFLWQHAAALHWPFANLDREFLEL